MPHFSMAAKRREGGKREGGGLFIFCSRSLQLSNRTYRHFKDQGQVEYNTGPMKKKKLSEVK